MSARMGGSPTDLVSLKGAHKGSMPPKHVNAMLKKEAVSKLYLEQKAVYNLMKR